MKYYQTKKKEKFTINLVKRDFKEMEVIPVLILIPQFLRIFSEEEEEDQEEEVKNEKKPIKKAKKKDYE